MELDLSKYIRKKTKAELLDFNNNFEDFKCNPLIKTKSIKEYFDNSHIFITGATGFLGKVLIEKLLRTCDGIEKIYILMRPKRGLSTSQRFEDFKKHKVFEKIREKFPEILNKLVCISGDINEPEIGLNEDDTELLSNRIDIVFHVAATVRFNEPLKNAAILNTFGTQRVMDLCTKMTNLKVSKQLNT
jgi:alcohol-forming fatty acyl-CoA reductase